MWNLDLYQWMNFSYSVILRPIDLSCTGPLENIGSLNYADFASIGTFHFTMSKIVFITITTNFIRKVLSTRKLSNSRWRARVFQNSNFCLEKFRSCHWLQILFSVKGQAHLFISKNLSSEYPVLNDYGSSVHHSFK